MMHSTQSHSEDVWVTSPAVHCVNIQLCWPVCFSVSSLNHTSYLTVKIVFLEDLRYQLAVVDADKEIRPYNTHLGNKYWNKVMRSKRKCVRKKGTVEFCPGPDPGVVKNSAHNPSAVSLLADRGPHAHPLSTGCKQKSCSGSSCGWREFLPTISNRSEVHDLKPEKTRTPTLCSFSQRCQ